MNTHALQTLTEVIKNDLMDTQVARDFMQNLIRDVGSSVGGLTEAWIPTCLVLLDLVEKILKSTTADTLQPLQMHLAYSLSSAITFFFPFPHLDRLETEVMLNLIII
ncbi:hypothetical protein AMECASPLE_029125 [Ameca splendens]|uniref:Uncharacterized protein n=1 Tax=Ameca splendens TaxID=208324 RepID=A0ABV0ZFK5_9TELE